jgi:D-lactate dehydrogenase
MKDGVFIINTARGELISTIDLYGAIIAGKIGGAGLDVLDYEDAMIKNDIGAIRNGSRDIAIASLINEKLLRLPNVVVTPHIAFNSSDAVRRILHISVGTILDFIGGKDIVSVT